MFYRITTIAKLLMIWAHTLLTKSTVKYRLVSNENKGKSLDPTVCYFSHVTRGGFHLTYEHSNYARRDLLYAEDFQSTFFFFLNVFYTCKPNWEWKNGEKTIAKWPMKKYKFSFIFNSLFLVKKNTVMIAFFYYRLASFT